METHKAKNSLPEIAELKARLIVSEDRTADFDLRTDLIMGKGEIFDEKRNKSYFLHARTAFIEVEYSGLDWVPGSKLGMEDNIGLTEKKITEEILVEGGASVGVRGCDASAKGSYKKKTDQSIQENNSKVTAISGDRWRVTDNLNRRLEGAMLNDRALMQFTRDLRTNKLWTGVRLTVRKRDLEIHSNLLDKFNPNKSRIIGILATKVIQRELPSPSDALTLSVVEQKDEKF